MIDKKYFKTPKAFDRCAQLHPKCLDIMSDMLDWCSTKGLPFMVTATASTLEEDHQLKRVSSTHREGRAFDLSDQGWTKELTDEFILTFGIKYSTVAAVSPTTLEPLLILHHDNGNGTHFHVQIRRLG